MFHSLALVEIEDGGAEHLFESLFQVTFIDGYFPAELLDGKGFADVLKENLASLDDLFPIGLVCKEFALKAFDFFFPDHTFQAVEEQHLALGIDIDVLVAAGIVVVEHSLQDEPGAAADGKSLAKGTGVAEFEQVFAGGAIRSPWFCKL